MLRSRGSSMSRDRSVVQKSVPAMISDAVGRSTTAPGPKVVMIWLGLRSPRIVGAPAALLLRAIGIEQIDATLSLHFPQGAGRIPMSPLATLGGPKEDLGTGLFGWVGRTPAVPKRVGRQVEPL